MHTPLCWILRSEKELKEHEKWMSESGLFNDILIKLGIIEQGKTYLAYPEYFWPIVVISDLWKEMGWNAIIYLAAIAGIDQEMYEAAKVDGASRFRQIISITLPSIAGTITILFILQVGGLLNSNFDQTFVLKTFNNESKKVWSTSSPCSLYFLFWKVGMNSAK